MFAQKGQPLIRKIRNWESVYLVTFCIYLPARIGVSSGSTGGSRYTKGIRARENVSGPRSTGWSRSMKKDHFEFLTHLSYPWIVEICRPDVAFSSDSLRPVIINSCILNHLKLNSYSKFCFIHSRHIHDVRPVRNSLATFQKQHYDASGYKNNNYSKKISILY